MLRRSFGLAVRIASRRGTLIVTTDSVSGPSPLCFSSDSDLKLRQEPHGLTWNGPHSLWVGEIRMGYEVCIWWLNLKLSFRFNYVFGVLFIYVFIAHTSLAFISK